MTAFTEFALDKAILQALSAKNYTEATPIQEQAIPAILEGRDVMAAAQTGTGKTAAFTLPMLQRLIKGPKAKSNHIRALVLTPTRELAAQVAQNVKDYSVHLPLTSEVVFGGVKINPQMQKLRKGVDVLVACPGRLLDLHEKNAVNFDHVEYLVLDEADRMLDMGFIRDIKKILRMLPNKRQNLLFSATFEPSIRELASTLMANPVEIDISPRNTTVSAVKQWLIPVDKSRKAALFIALCEQQRWQQLLVFCRTRHGADRLCKQLNKKEISAKAIHGNKSQGARTRALAEFKANDVQILVATDIAARGLDISDLPAVVNFDLPQVAADYVHRIGRTGRAGSMGEAVSLVCAEELETLQEIEGLIGESLERIIEPKFEPSLPLPTSVPKKPKKPKKAKPSKPRAASEGGARNRSRPSRNR